MRQILFHVGPLPIYSFGVAICLGFMQAFWLTRLCIARDRVDPPWAPDATDETKKSLLEWIYDLGFGAMIGAVVGARLFHVIFEVVLGDNAALRASYRNNLFEVFKVWNGGLVWYGGFVGAFLVCFWMVWKKRMHPWQLGDFIAPSISFGYAIGRLGCFMNGCCFGRESKGGFCVVFRQHPDHLCRIPTQLYESASGLLIGFFLLWLLPRRAFRGQVWWSYVAIYAVARFIVEFWRDDPRGEYGPLMTSQWIAVLLFPAAIVGYVLCRRKYPVESAAAEPAVEKA